MMERRVNVKTPSTSKEPVPMATVISEIPQTDVGLCYATRTITSHSLTTEALAPQSSISTAQQVHVNGNCIKNAGLGLLGVGTAIVVSPISVPVMGGTLIMAQ